MESLWTDSGYGLPPTVALALVALLGYIVGLIRKSHTNAERSQADAEKMQADADRAQTVLRDLEAISQQVRTGLATHHSSILQFKERLAALTDGPTGADQRELRREAEKMLEPTVQLARQIAQAYDDIRQQAAALGGVPASTLDAPALQPISLESRNALEQAIRTQFALFARYGNRFSVVLLDIDGFRKTNDLRGRDEADRLLLQVSEILASSIRETDLLSRFGGEEFVLVLPETDLVGACILAERLRAAIEMQTALRVSGGVASAIDSDSPKTLLSRADSALYSAKAAGQNRVFQHTGRQIVPVAVPELLAQLTAAKTDN